MKTGLMGDSLATAAGSLRASHLLVSVKTEPQQQFHGADSVTQAFVSVRKHPVEPKSDPLCGGRDLLTKTTFQPSVVPLRLACCSSDGEMCAKPEKSVCCHMAEQGDTGIHLCPRCRRAPPIFPAQQDMKEHRLCLKASAQPGEIPMYCPPKVSVSNKLKYTR